MKMGGLSFTSVTLMVSAVRAVWAVSEAVIRRRYSRRDSKSRRWTRVILPLNLSTLKTPKPVSSASLIPASESLSVENPYVSAGFVSTSLAVTAVSTVPTSVPEKNVQLNTCTEDTMVYSSGDCKYLSYFE
jgi:hypothetical protein